MIFGYCLCFSVFNEPFTSGEMATNEDSLVHSMLTKRHFKPSEVVLRFSRSTTNPKHRQSFKSLPRIAPSCGLDERLQSLSQQRLLLSSSINIREFLNSVVPIESTLRCVIARILELSLYFLSLFFVSFERTVRFSFISHLFRFQYVYDSLQWFRWIESFRWESRLRYREGQAFLHDADWEL